MTDDGIVTLSRFSQKVKAASPIDLQPSGITTDFTFVLLLYAQSAIPTSDLGSVIDALGDAAASTRIPFTITSLLE